MSEACPLCERDIVFRSDHHLIPKSRGGKQTVTICQDCHSAVHAIFSNKELEYKCNSVQRLLANGRFAKTVRFLSKQDPHKRFRSKKARKKH